MVGEQSDSRALFSLTVTNGEVTRTTLRLGEPMPWDAGHVEKDELPWLGHEASLTELERREEEALAAVAAAPPSPDPKERGGSRRR